VEGAGRSRGVGTKTRKVLSSRNYRDRSRGPIKHKTISTANTEIQVITINCVLTRRVRAFPETRKCREQFQPRDHSAWGPHPGQWAKSYIRIGTLVR